MDIDLDNTELVVCEHNIICLQEGHFLYHVSQHTECLSDKIIPFVWDTKHTTLAARLQALADTADAGVVPTSALWALLAGRSMVQLPAPGKDESA